MISRSVFPAILCCLLLAGFRGTPAQQTATRPGQPSGLSTAPDVSPALKYFTDVRLVNQNGESLRFYSDLLKGKIVVIHAFFTSCQGSCPVMARTMSLIQESLADRLGKDVFLLSVSVDPENDTPDKLKIYAERFGARAGWHFLTGKKENVDWALYKLGQYVETREGHLNVMIIGNEPAGVWEKVFSLAKPEAIIKRVEEVINSDGT